MLAERALKGIPSTSASVPKAGEEKELENIPSTPTTEAAATHQYHIDEMLQLFPTLQYGMDVNPKFNCGPTGVEYTIGVNAFDLMNVDLVHGWLIDENDHDVQAVIGTKTYNELTEILIHGTDARDKIPLLMSKIDELEKEISDLTLEMSKTDKGSEKGASLEAMEKVTLNDNDQDDKEGTNTSSIESKEEDIERPSKESTAAVKLQSLQRTLSETKDEFDRQSKIASDSAIVDDFLQSTSHQLTYTGLAELHNHISEGKMCVFFRNNHFATMTKSGGHLYLLVTDLGYANVPDVLWEKLDDISGDTEYADHQFMKTKPASNISAAPGPTLSPEQMLAQRAGAERDYELALQLSRNENALDEQEGKLIAAATAASLQEFHGKNGEVQQQGPDNNGTVASIPTSSQSMSYHQEEQDRMVAMQLQAQSDSGHGNYSSHHQEEQDRMVAMQLQAQFREDAGARRNLPRPRQHQQSSSDGGRSRKDSGCLIC